MKSKHNIQSNYLRVHTKVVLTAYLMQLLSMIYMYTNIKAKLDINKNV